jgi:hypothetical protein
MRRVILPALAAVLLAGVALAKDEAIRVFDSKFKEPQVAVAPDGHIFVVAGTDDSVQVAVSKDGKTFEKPVVAGKGKVALGMRRGPRIAATAKSIVATAVAMDGENKGNVISWRSGDEGTTWEGPAIVNKKGESAREGLQGLAAGQNDDVACVWLDLRANSTEIYASISKDGGKNWGDDVKVYSSPDGHTCECCHPSVAWNSKGELAVMWRNWLDGSRDMWIALSKDGGKTFTKGQKLGEGSWPLKACPMDGGAVAGSSDGVWTTVWRRDRDVFLAAAGKAERSLGAGVQPWVAIGPGGAFAAWLDKAGGTLYVAGPKKEAAEVATGAQDPAMAGALDGKGPVVLAWWSDGGVMSRVLVGRK